MRTYIFWVYYVYHIYRRKDMQKPLQAITNHTKPWKPIKNMQKPSKINNHQKPVK